jgi:hypothetical protein
MSGPIVRKYGFPNFEKIFGERSLQHGVDDAEAPAAAATQSPASPPSEPAKAGSRAKKSGKKKA